MGCREGVGGGRSTARAAGQHNPRGGKGRCFVHAHVDWSCPVSAVSARSALAVCGCDSSSVAARAVPGGQGRPERRFHALQDKVYRRDVLWRAWVAVRTNNGAPGIDKTTLAEVEEYGVARLLGELADELRQRAGGRCRRGGCLSPSRAGGRIQAVGDSLGS